MELYKTIIQGRLEFGTKKSFDTVTKMYTHRLENYHKSEIIFPVEEIFFEDNLTLNIPRHVGQSTEKTWRNTFSLLEYCGQFAVSGEVGAWQTNQGKIINYGKVEPDSDKAVVVQFQKGKKLAFSKGKEEEALEALTKAIEKYDKHAQAYERRGKVNYWLKRYHDAARDYNKCIAVDGSVPDAYYGLAKIHVINKEYEEAVENLELTIKKSLALQPIYWKARRLKAGCHQKLKQYEKAAFDLKLFTNRQFDEADTNFIWKRSAFKMYVEVLIELEDYPTALEAVEKAILMDDVKDKVKKGELLMLRGITKKAAGKNGFIKDFKEASEMGIKKAAKLLVGHK